MGVRTGRPRGRPKGAPNKATAARQAEIAASGLTPLDYMLGLLRDERLDQMQRFEAAKAAAPYVHPRLTAVDMNAQVKVNPEDALDELE